MTGNCRSKNSELVQAFRNDKFDLCILPTEQCNFRCTYCYEDFSIGKMKPEIVEGVKNLMSRRAPELSLLSVSWFGGEPMLAFDVVQDVSLYAKRLSEAHPRLRYKGSMTTNGSLLTSERVAELEEMGVTDFQISLDGPKELHDGTRLRANGGGTFDQVWKNLVGIKDSSANVKIIIRVHVTQVNLQELPEFLIKVREIFLTDSRFEVYIKPVEKLGGMNDSTLPVLSREQKEDVVSELRAIVRGSEQDRDVVFSEPGICYACASNFLMIRANGTLGKCTVAMGDDRNAIGHINSDGSLDIDQNRARPWLRGWTNMDPRSLQCPYGAMRDEDRVAEAN